MTNPTTALVPHSTVREIVAKRDEAVALFEEYFEAVGRAHETLGKAQAAVLAACGGTPFAAPYVSEDKATEIKSYNRAITPPNVETLKRVARRLTDIQVWGSLIERTELEVLMDKTAKDELRSQLEYVPEETGPGSEEIINQAEIDKQLPPISEDSILATLEVYRESCAEIWKRGIATAFSALDRRFRSHDGFKIGNRIILSHAFNEWGSWSYSRHHQDTLLDIERIFLVLDGKLPQASYGGIIGTIKADREGSKLEQSLHGGRLSGPRQSTHEGDYFRVNVFKNGNAHLWFTRKDLVEKVNKLLEEYYGAGLGWGASGEAYDDEPTPDRVFETALDRAPAKNFGLYPTPDALAERVIEAASLWKADDTEPLSVLEPSAGTGQLAERANALGHRVTVVEIQPELAARLGMNGYVKTHTRDFLKMTPEPVFDRVIMNPPFDRQRDLDHVHHALQFVKPGGRLVAIMAAGVEYSESKKAVALRREIEEGFIGSHQRWGGNQVFADLPEGSFRECGTNVNTVLLSVVRKG